MRRSDPTGYRPPVDWEGQHPHHWIDPTTGMASIAARERAYARMAVEPNLTYAHCLRRAIAALYELAINFRDTCPETGNAWTLNDVPDPYRGLAANTHELRKAAKEGPA